mgnify:CR=1 FL=1
MSYYSMQRVREKLSEQHPREQGLKPFTLHGIGVGSDLSEQHPREQGLKP